MSSELVEQLNLVKRIASLHAALIADPGLKRYINNSVCVAVGTLERAALKLNLEMGKSVDNMNLRAVLNPKEPKHPKWDA